MPSIDTDCAWCGGSTAAAAKCKNRRGEIFCSPSHRRASNAALKALVQAEEPAASKKAIKPLEIHTIECSGRKIETWDLDDSEMGKPPLKLRDDDIPNYHARPEHDDECMICSRPLRTAKARWVECIGGALIIIPVLDYTPEERAEIESCGGYMGCYPIGRACAKKLPRKFWHV